MKLKFAFWVMLSISAIAHAGVNSWTSNGPYRLGIRDIAIHPTNPKIILVAHWFGISRSTDGGTTWQLNTQLDGNYIIRFSPADPNVVLAAGERIYRSTDAGNSWNILRANSQFDDFEFHPTDPNVLFATGGRIYESKDGGKSWTWKFRTPPVKFGGGSRIKFDPQDPKRIYAFLQGNFCRSFDGGNTWTMTKPGLQLGGPIVLLVARSGVLFAGGTPEQLGFFRSTDSGNSWQRLPGRNMEDATIISSNPIVILAAGGGVSRYKSDENQWRRVNPPGATNQFYSVTASSDGKTILLGSADTGLFISKDGGTKWTNLVLPLSSSLNGLAFESLTLDLQNRRIIAGASGEAYVSSDDGLSWNLLVHGIFPLPGIEKIQVYQKDSNFMLGTGGSRALAFSSSGGRIWRRITTPGLALAAVFDPNNEKIFYITGESSYSVARTLDQGKTWEILNKGLSNKNISIILVDPNDSRHVIAGAPNDGIVYVSHDGGETWQDRSPRPTGSAPQLLALAIHPRRSNELFASFEVFPNFTDRSGSNKILFFKSTDDGSTWVQKNKGLTSPVNSLYFDPLNLSRVLASGLNSIYISNDDAETWERFPFTGISVNPNAVDFLRLPWDPKLFVLVASQGIFTYQRHN